jgi:hypothetical protein
MRLHAFFTVLRIHCVQLLPSIGGDVSAAPLRPARRRRRARQFSCRVEQLEQRLAMSGTSVGVNLDGISDSSPVWVFNDAFLESRDWIPQAYDTVTGITTWGAGGQVYVDASDWPTQLPQWVGANGDLMQQRLGTLMFRDIDGKYPAGVYTAEWQGTGVVNFGFDARVIQQGNYSDGTHYALLQVTPSSAGIYVEIASTLASDRIRNMHVWMPDANGQAQRGTVWTPGASFSPFTSDFLAELSPFNTLRFMDWMSTNVSTVSQWADRRPLTYARQAGGTNGVSYEYMIELANELNANIWINLPYLASDSFNTQLATLVKTNLKSTLTVTIEWSNEVWNSQFDTFNWITTQLPSNPTMTRNQFIAAQTKQDFAIWSQVFTGQSGRLVRVVAGQAVDSLGTDEILANMNGQFDEVATAAYITLTSDQMASFTATTTGDEVLNAAFADLSTTIAGLQAHDALAGKYSTSLGRTIKFVSYEGGQHLSALGQTVVYQQALYDAQVNPRIYGLYKQLITQFTALGGSLFMHYSNISPNSKFGSYGALQYLKQPISQAPKYRALVDAISGTWAVPTSAPPAPTKLVATTVSSTGIDLSWSDLLGSEDGFKVESSTDGVTYTQIATLAAGTLSYSVRNLPLSTNYTFRVRAYNAFGNSGYSNTSTASTGVSSGLTSFDLSSGFASAATLLQLNGTAAINGNLLTLTDGGLYEAGSAFTKNLVSVATFTTQFTFQLLNPAADGFMFVIQGVGPTALGGVGGNLGYSDDGFPGGHPGIGNSVAIKFDLASNENEGGNSTGLYLNGQKPTLANSFDLTNSGINLHSGHIFSVSITYDGTTMRVTISDTTTGTAAARDYTVSFGPSAYIGFTGGTGGMSAIQSILTWKYSTGVAPAVPAPPSNLTAAYSAGQVNLAWTNNATNQTGFRIERKVGTTGTYALLTTVGAGVTSWIDTTAVAGQQYFYRVAATNSVGASGYSNEASVVVSSALTSLNYASGFASAGTTITKNGAATVTGSDLVLTNGGLYQSSSAFTSGLVSVAAFSTQFNFQLLNAQGDGFMFVIQSSSPTALGGLGGSLGFAADTYTGGHAAIANSVGIKFDLADNSGEGSNSTGLYINGAMPTNLNSVNLTSAGIDLHSGHTFSVAITYDGVTMVVKITDTVTGGSATQSYQVSLGPTAYVGFTAGTGGVSATQKILNWTLTSGMAQAPAPAAPSNLTATASGSTQVNLAWTNNATNQTGFLIERKIGASGTYVQIASVAAGVTTYTDTNVVSGTQYYYRVRATNAGGNSAYSNEANATTSSVAVNYSNGFASAGSALTLNGSSAVSGSALVLTNGGTYQSASAFTSTMVNTSTFNTQFSFQLTNPAADGFTFTIQSSSPTALGGVGGALGYGADGFAGGRSGIASSVAIKFDLADNAGEGNNSTGLYINGAAPTSANSMDLTSAGINLHSGHVFNVAITYDGLTLRVTITDATTGASATQNYQVVIAQMAYVGFTAGTGGLSATQKILSWRFATGIA